MKKTITLATAFILALSTLSISAHAQRTKTGQGKKAAGQTVNISSETAQRQKGGLTTAQTKKAAGGNSLKSGGGGLGGTADGDGEKGEIKGQTGYYCTPDGAPLTVITVSESDPSGSNASVRPRSEENKDSSRTINSSSSRRGTRTSGFSYQFLDAEGNVYNGGVVICDGVAEENGRDPSGLRDVSNIHSSSDDEDGKNNSRGGSSGGSSRGGSSNADSSNNSGSNERNSSGGSSRRSTTGSGRSSAS